MPSLWLRSWQRPARASGTDACTTEGFGQPLGGGVFVDVIGLQRGHGKALNAQCCQVVEGGLVESGALAQAQAVLRSAVGQDGIQAVLERLRSKLYSGCPSSGPVCIRPRWRWQFPQAWLRRCPAPRARESGQGLPEGVPLL